MTNGDERAFEVLYERYNAVLFRYCKAILRSDDDAEEAFQVTMLNAYRALARGRGGNTMRPWLYQIAHNQCVSTIRSRRPAESLGDHDVANTSTVHEQVEIQEQVRQLRTDLDSLPPMQRSALVMREMSGLSHRAIGAALETSPSDARQLVYEARQSLAEFNAGRELSCTEVRRRISDGDRRRLRGRRVRAHLRACSDCDAFAVAQVDRRRALASFFPVLPAAASARILQEVLASGGGISAGAAGVGGAGAGSLGSTAGAGGVATAGTGVAGVGAGFSGVVGSAGTVASIGGLAASGLLKAGSGTAAAGPAGMLSTTTAGGVASAGVAALSVIVAAAVTIGGGQAPTPGFDQANAAPPASVSVTGTVPVSLPLVEPDPADREGDIAIAVTSDESAGVGATPEPTETAGADGVPAKVTKTDPGATIVGPGDDVDSAPDTPSPDKTDAPTPDEVPSAPTTDSTSAVLPVPAPAPVAVQPVVPSAPTPAGQPRIDLLPGDGGTGSDGGEEPPADPDGSPDDDSKDGHPKDDDPKDDDPKDDDPKDEGKKGWSEQTPTADVPKIVDTGDAAPESAYCPVDE